jgi:ABC-type taurine transport system ATPase subunit
MSGEAKLIIQDLCHHYPDEYTGESVHALEGINLQVYENEFVAIVGPSGCGKTTLLNIVAGLLPYREGRAMVDGNEIHGPGPDRGVVFQEHAILPWRSVARNIGHGLELQRVRSGIYRPGRPVGFRGSLSPRIIWRHEAAGCGRTYIVRRPGYHVDGRAVRRR